jgi:hypothetical protein
VLSIATDSTRRAFSHSAIRINSAVVAPKLAISRPLSSAVGAHAQWRSLPRSIPAFRRITGKPRSCLRLPSELSISCFPALSLPHLSEHARPGWPCVDSDLGENFGKPRQCTIAFLEPCCFCGIRTNGNRVLTAVALACTIALASPKVTDYSIRFKPEARLLSGTNSQS